MHKQIHRIIMVKIFCMCIPSATCMVHLSHYEILFKFSIWEFFSNAYCSFFFFLWLHSGHLMNCASLDTSASVHSCWSTDPHTNSAASGIAFLLQSQCSQQRDKGQADYLTTRAAGPSEEGRNTAVASLFHPEGIFPFFLIFVLFWSQHHLPCDYGNEEI